MKNLLKKLSAAFITLAIIFGAGYSAHQVMATLSFVQTPTITLYASISGSATSMRITPYPKDLDGVKLTMTDFGTSPTATIDPKVRNVEEIVGFTGIVDNGDNTATLTGLSRDLTSKFPYTTTGAGRSHSASAIVVFSNNPQMYNRLAGKENNETVTGLWTFTQTPLGINPGGQPNASETVNGVGQLANGAQAAAGTSLGSTAARLLIPASLATSTCQFATTSVLVTPVGTGKLATGCFDPTGSWTFTGANTFGSTTFASTATTTLSGTTTIAASASNKLTLNTVPYVAPSSQGVASTFLKNDGSGNLSWGTPQTSVPVNGINLAVNATNNSGATTTIATYTIPANTIAANKVLRLQSYWAESAASGQCKASVGYGSGNATSTIGFSDFGSNNAGGSIINTIAGTGASTEQTSGLALGNTYYSTTTTTAFTLSAATYLSFATIGAGSGNCGLTGYSIEILSN